MLADRRRLWRVVWVATLASVLGGLVGYAIGRLLYETLVVWLVDLYGWQASFATIQTEFHQQGALIVLIGALTPIPFKLIAIASGVERLDLWLFLGVALFGRAGRFLSFGLLIWWLGLAGWCCCCWLAVLPQSACSDRLMQVKAAARRHRQTSHNSKEARDVT
jgi:membrane protein YqaA with SNARE-associated domain